jgi:hypothetical protein
MGAVADVAHDLGVGINRVDRVVIGGGKGPQMQA